MSLASVKTSVLFLGQRVLYDISKADADVLEDESDTCLWCWETRDLKLFPPSVRGVLNTRRMARKKIHERISAFTDNSEGEVLNRRHAEVGVSGELHVLAGKKHRF